MKKIDKDELEKERLKVIQAISGLKMDSQGVCRSKQSKGRAQWYLHAWRPS